MQASRGSAEAPWVLGFNDNRATFLQELAAQMGVRSAADWALVTRKDVCEAGGKALLSRHGNSLREALQQDLGIDCPIVEETGFPEGYWDSRLHRVELLQSLAVKNGIEAASDWRRVSPAAVRRCRGGGAFLARYGGSWAAALADNLADDAVTLQRMGEEGTLGRQWAGKEVWESERARRQFGESLAGRLGVKEKGDWRHVTAADVRAQGGGGWLAYYSGSLAAAVGELLQEEVQLEHRRTVPARHWETDESIAAFLHSAAEMIGVETAEEWYRVGSREVKEVSGGRSFLKHVGLVDGLRVAYPRVQWDEARLKAAGKKAGQRQLAGQVCRLFPGVALVEDHRHEMLDTAQGGPLLELDVYLPQLQLAFEYNGPQHYEEIAFFGPLETIRRRDLRKEELCREAGIRLVQVPHWWDRQRVQRAAALRGDRILRTARDYPTEGPPQGGALQGGGIRLVQVPHWWDSLRVQRAA
eukprot:CAMPEP_0114610524 /NCGR_PEP_ID=MMETSP0168-20121206/3647_1 /TAXON_ID=95228 ORGANISM="Vannella sp., Strain DIVA3 517/6/12" /NCGR_SAMPLE_ID=MMETSP0168 /ASSEMBLY_ACC=CAM_ASM_000044 /LENGTH=470 /DNA_ID=CAMNT_0001821473 /DNA_START=1 /DNA_END=1412 /DNA_ORIENTATION=+